MVLNKHYYGSMQGRMFCFAQQYSRKVNYVIVNNKEKIFPNLLYQS